MVPFQDTHLRKVSFIFHTKRKVSFDLFDFLQKIRTRSWRFSMVELFLFLKWMLITFFTAASLPLLTFPERFTRVYSTKTVETVNRQNENLTSHSAMSVILSILLPFASPLAHLHVVVMLWFVSDINQPSLPTPFYSALVSYFCLYGSFNCISFHKFSRSLFVLSLCSSGLISAILVLSTT